MICFISDIHLNPEFPERTERFRSFVDIMRQRPESPADLQVYILGDLFDFWYERNRGLFEYYAKELELLRELAQSVKSVGIIFGNRDFSYEEHFPRHVGSNIRILGDEAEVLLNGKRTLLIHGDLLCRNDGGYLRFRRLIRSPLAKMFFGWLPWFAAKWVIKKMMRSSVEYQTRTEQKILEMDESAIAEKFKRGFDTMIFVHVHRQSSQSRSVDGRSCELVSPGSCIDRLEFAVLDDDGLRFHP